MVSSVQDKGYRAIIDKFDIHHGAEHACRDNGAQRFHSCDKVLIQFVAFFRACRIGKARPSSFSAVAVQGKLRYDERAAARVNEGTVHFPLCVAKDAELKAFVGKKVRLCGCVVFVDGEEYEHARPDAAVECAVDGDRGLFHTLQDYTQNPPLSLPLRVRPRAALRGQARAMHL